MNCKSLLICAGLFWACCIPIRAEEVVLLLDGHRYVSLDLDKVTSGTFEDSGTTGVFFAGLPLLEDLPVLKAVLDPLHALTKAHALLVAELMNPLTAGGAGTLRVRTDGETLDLVKRGQWQAAKIAAFTQVRNEIRDIPILTLDRLTTGTRVWSPTFE
ncbi:MAG: hypothetical protein ACTSX8_11005 [Alphaproteobacteria bacterium]